MARRRFSTLPARSRVAALPASWRLRVWPPTCRESPASSYHSVAPVRQYGRTLAYIESVAHVRTGLIRTKASP